MPAAKDRLVARLRQICLEFPEAVEKVSHGEPTWFAGKGKVFAMLDDHHHGSSHLAVWLPQPAGRQADLIDADPDALLPPALRGPQRLAGCRAGHRPGLGHGRRRW